MSQFAGGLKTLNGKATSQALYDYLISVGYPSTISPEDGAVPSSISAVDSKFKMPQVGRHHSLLTTNFLSHSRSPSLLKEYSTRPSMA